MNVKPVTEVIREAAETMHSYSERMNKLADDIESSGDLSSCGEALNMISNMLANIRMDLFVTRPIREYEKELR